MAWLCCVTQGYDKLSVDAVREFGGVQEKVLAIVTEYWQCRKCKKVYWEGPKFESTREKFGAMVPGGEAIFDE